jgi:hypothetical protein
MAYVYFGFRFAHKWWSYLAAYMISWFVAIGLLSYMP